MNGGYSMSMRWLASILAFVCCAFGAAPTAATGPFMVFFDSGSARLTQRAETILDNAAGWFRRAGIQRLRLVGSADRVGTSSSNFALSRRRAQNVKAALVRRGVPATAIEVAGRGEEQLLVETPDGVPEEHNRYVILEVLAFDAPASEPQS